ncbi:MAG TPA: 2OG-Fe(II) oxygenase [Rhizomicrobium sp.]|jgi:hypothetical protein
MHRDWHDIESDLNTQGWALLPKLIPASAAARLRGLYDRDIFRSHIIMGRHGFGRGEYKYFSYPLPDPLTELRPGLYEQLAPIANRWAAVRDEEARYPARHGDFLDRCHQAGQARPTPLLLKYGPGDYNCLHQDLYGEHVFPLQVAILLSEPGSDFTGGEFVMTEQRPRSQSRASVIPLGQGDGVVFAVHRRPVKGKKGIYTVNHRHGVSALVTGERYTLGVIFHDAA